jgi:DNA-binding response OmpR family regulator
MSPSTTAPVIVVVEDPLIRRYVRNVLGKSGHQVMESDAQDALKLASDGSVMLKLVITNQPQVFEDLDRSVPILYLSATPDWTLASRLPNMRVLLKPFRAHELLEAVAAVTALS